VSKKIISIILLLSFVDFVNAGEIEHFSSEDALKKNYPFSEAVRVDDVLYISGMVAEGDDGQVIKGES
jgi:Putative translation initiation inhibitor, yjgF family